MITKNRPKQFGYSLIELLAVMAIVAISVAITLPNLDNYRSQRDLFNGANMIREAVNKAKIAAAAPAQNNTEGYEASLIEFYVNSDPSSVPEEADLINEYSLSTSDGTVKNKKVITLPGSVVVGEIDDETANRIDSGNSRMGIAFLPAGAATKLYNSALDSDPTNVSLSQPFMSTYVIKLTNLDTGQEKMVEVQLATGAVHVN